MTISLSSVTSRVVSLIAMLSCHLLFYRSAHQTLRYRQPFSPPDGQCRENELKIKVCWCITHEPVTWQTDLVSVRHLFTFLVFVSLYTVLENEKFITYLNLSFDTIVLNNSVQIGNVFESSLECQISSYPKPTKNLLDDYYGMRLKINCHLIATFTISVLVIKSQYETA